MTRVELARRSPFYPDTPRNRPRSARARCLTASRPRTADPPNTIAHHGASGGFEDDGVAGCERGTGLGKIDLMRKVEWCDRAFHRCAATSGCSACGAAECAVSLKSAGKCRVGMSRSRARLRPRGEHGHNGPYLTKENMMAKYLLLKHYRGAPAAVNDVPMDQWTPERSRRTCNTWMTSPLGSRAPVSSSTRRRFPRRAHSSAMTAKGGRR